MPSTTSIPAVIDAILDLFQQAPGLGADGVQILDGQSTHYEPDTVVVGYSPVRPTTEITQTRQNLAATRDQETYDLVCLASSERGDPDMRTVRNRVAELVDAMNTALMADRRLGGACLHAQMTVATWEQAQTESGPAATAEVLISITAMTSR